MRSLLSLALVVCAARQGEARDYLDDADLQPIGYGAPCRDCQPSPPCPSPQPYFDAPVMPQDGALGPWSASPNENQTLQAPSPAIPDANGAFENGNDFGGPTAAGESNLPSGLGAVAAAESSAVHMIGDFFGSGYFLGGPDGFATTPAAGGDRRFKATDNLSPLPQDRVFFNYHHFQDAVSDVFGVNRNVDRFTFGLERTFFENNVSLEVRIPFASGLGSAQSFSSTDSTAAEFGNVALTVKGMLWQQGSLAFTSGLATVLPTGSDASVRGDDTLTVLENDAVHLQPYLGVSYSNPCKRLFSTSYVAVDVDVNGNALSTDASPFGSPGSLAPLGDVRDQTLLFLDWQVGYWVYQDYEHIGYLNRIAPILELHYSRALEDPVDLGVYTNPFGKADLLNLTAGVVFELRRTLYLTVYGAAPLLREEAVLFGRTVSPVFQSEFGAQCVYRY